MTNIDRMSRREETRARLRFEALRLFGERGFDAVTVDEVAAAAGVSHMTFFRHFPTKEAVVMDDPYDPLLAVAVVAQDASLPVLERVRLGLLAAWADPGGSTDEETRQRVGLVAEHPRLQAHIWLNNQRTADAISEALIADDAPPFETRVACGAVMGALTAALLDWSVDYDSGPLGPRIEAALDVLGPRGVRS